MFQTFWRLKWLRKRRLCFAGQGQQLAMCSRNKAASFKSLNTGGRQVRGRTDCEPKQLLEDTLPQTSCGRPSLCREAAYLLQEMREDAMRPPLRQHKMGSGLD